MQHELSRRKLAIVLAAHVVALSVLVTFRGCSFSKPQENVLEMVPLGTDNPGEGMPVRDSLAGEQAAKGREAPAPAQPTPQPPQPPAQPTPPPPPQPTPPAPKQPEPVHEEESAKEEPKDTTPSPIPDDTPPKPVKKQEPKKKKPEPKPEPKVQAPQPQPQQPAPNNQAAKPTNEKKSTSINVDLKKVVRTAPGGTGTGNSVNKAKDDDDGPVGGGGKGKPGSRGINKGDIEGQAGVMSAGSLKESLNRSLQSVGVAGGTGSGQYGSPDGKNSEAARYNLLIKETIERNWRKPNLPEIAQLETGVLIRIAPDGTLTFITTRKSSGNSDMDESVRAAIRTTTRIPERLPDGLGTPNYDVSINFRLR